MADLNALKEAVVEMQEETALSLTKQYLAEGVDAVALFGAYQEALGEIGKRFEQQIYFIPELIMSGEMMKSASELIKPHLPETEGSGDKLGKIVITSYSIHYTKLYDCEPRGTSTHARGSPQTGCA